MTVRTVHRADVVVREEVVAIQCNVCGAEKTLAEYGPYNFTSNMHAIVISGSYGDTYPGDMEDIRFTVCGKCLGDWTQTFKVPVDSHNPMFPQETEACAAIHSETGARWLVAGGWAYPEDTVFEHPATLPVLKGVYPASGVWEHFKGRQYQVLSCVRSFLKSDDVLVVYRALYEDSLLFIRPLAMWGEMVPHPEHGYLVPRFQPLLRNPA